MNKKELVEAVAAKTGSTKKDAAECLNAVVELITAELKEGHSVELAGFGKFEVKKRKARTGINPATKEQIKIKASKAPAFKAAKALKEAVK